MTAAPRSARLDLRVSPDSLRCWRAAAAAERLSLSEWLHRLADAETEERGRPRVRACPWCGGEI